MKVVHFVVLLATVGRLHQGVVALKCSEVSQVGPGNTFLSVIF